MKVVSLLVLALPFAVHARVGDEESSIFSRFLSKDNESGGATPIQDGECLQCDSDNKNRPTMLSFEYIPGPGETSAYQTIDKADCVAGAYPGGSYPDAPDLSVDGETITLDAKKFTLTSEKFDAFTHFDFGDTFSCFIHTSCSQPLVVGDQFGPFKLIASDDCGNPPTGPDPGVPCEEETCVICDSDNKNKPDSLTFRFHTAGVNSEYQPEDKATCRERAYAPGLVIASDKKGNEIDRFELADGDEFTLTTTEDSFDSETNFLFSDGFECFIHTSCSVPIVRGDQIGALEVLAGNECLPCPAQPCCEVFGEYKDGKIIVDFRNQCTDPNMEDEFSKAFPDDWVGLYPCDYEEDTDFPTHSPRPNDFQGAWMYTCYEPFGDDENCQNTISDDQTVKQGQMTFEYSRAPGYSLQVVYGHPGVDGDTNYDANGNFPPGCYVAIMNHNDGESEPPAYIACQGNDFMVG